MIFAVATDERTLLVFGTANDAIAYCEGIDVEDAEWLFWDETGNALEAQFLIRNSRSGFTVGSSTYELVQAPAKPTLSASLQRIGQIEVNSHFATLSEVQAHLAAALQVLRAGA